MQRLAALIVVFVAPQGITHRRGGGPMHARRRPLALGSVVVGVEGWRRRGLFVIAALAAAAVAAAPASALPSRPDLVPLLPKKLSPRGVPRIYVDRFQSSNHLLYRFDAVILNQGGTLDLFRDPDTGHATQAVWNGGIPTQTPDPNHPPTDGPNVTLYDRNGSGARFVYSPLPGHVHWHFQASARYGLIVPNRGVRMADKIGFCLLDSWNIQSGRTKRFAEGYIGSGPRTWCAPAAPGATFTRMGITAQWGDLYQAQVADQWVDVTGLRPGNYQLRATVNPLGYIREYRTDNNRRTVTRTIPGTRAHGGKRGIPAGGRLFTVSGEIVAPGIAARRSAAPCQMRINPDCYIWARAGGPLTFTFLRMPAHGTLNIGTRTFGLEKRVRYIPDSGFHGTDSFTFRVTDNRGLQSRIATIRLDVA
jgi:hypothetical protein